MVRRGFTLLEVLLAIILLGFGVTMLLTSMMNAQKTMLGSSFLETAEEVMDLGEMAYPLADVQDPDQDLDVPETKATELWEKISDDARLTSAQEEKFHGFTWEREALNRQDSDEVERLGGLYTVKVTVRWGDRFRGHGEEESYVTFWRKSDE